MRILVFGMILLLLSCHPADVGLGANAYSNLKYDFKSGSSDLIYSNQNVSQIQLSFQTSDTLTEDIAIALTFESENLTSDQVFSDFNQKIIAQKGLKSFNWLLTINPTLSTTQKLAFKIKIKDYNDKIQFTPDSFSYDFQLNFATPIITSPAANSYINNQNQNNFSISGSCEKNDTVTIKVKSHPEINTSVQCTENQNFSASLNLSTITDGNVILQSYQTNQYNNASPISEITYIKNSTTKDITLSSDSHLLKNSTSSTTSFTLSGRAFISTQGENESLYKIYLFKDPTCSVNLANSTISSNHFSFAVVLSGITEGPVKFYARLKNAAGSLLNCTDLNFSYFYTPRNILIGGNFDTINGNNFKNIAKINADGSVKSLADFPVGTGYTHASADDYVRVILPLVNSKFLIGGLFDTFNGISVNNMNILSSSVLNITGIFPPFNDSIKTAVTDGSGNIYIGGNFDFSYGQTGGNITRRGLVKLDSNLNLIDGFSQNLLNSNIIQSSNYVRSIITTDSGIYIGGRFPGLIAKIDFSGSEDTTFKSNMGAGFLGNAIFDIKRLDSGDLIIGGEFSTYKGIPCPNIAKISSSGILDTEFCANSVNLNLDNYVLTIEKASDNNLYIGGAFTKKIISISTSCLVNLEADFGTAFDGTVYTIREFVDGKLLIGGEFSNYNDNPYPGLIKINKSGSIDSTFQGNGKFSSGQGVYTIQF